MRDVIQVVATATLAIILQYINVSSQCIHIAMYKYIKLHLILTQCYMSDKYMRCQLLIIAMNKIILKQEDGVG